MLPSSFVLLAQPIVQPKMLRIDARPDITHLGERTAQGNPSGAFVRELFR